MFCQGRATYYVLNYIELTLNKKTDNPKIVVKVLSDGRQSLGLQYNYGYNSLTGKTERKTEFLKLYIQPNAKNPIERQRNKEALELAEKIRFEREQRFKQDTEGYRLSSEQDTNLFVFWSNFIDGVKVADNRLLRSALQNFQQYIKEEYPQFANRVEAKNLNKELMQGFAHFIEDNHRGEGVRTYWQRFKRLVNYAVEKKVIRESPCKGIKVMSTNDILSKDILSREELQKLFATHYEKESETIRRAFALTCFTGIRYCDIKRLTYKNIDYSNKLLTFRQNKVKHDSSVSGVPIPLNDMLIAVIGKKPKGAKDSELIFGDLPSLEACLKALKHWTKRAGIDKRITWHSGRHSFATNLLSNGVNIKVVSELLGHSSLKFTQKYVRAMDEQKRAAINSLPPISIDNI